VGKLGKALAHKKITQLKPGETPLHYMNLQEVEDACRLYSAYAWLAYRQPNYFPDTELAQRLSREASERVDAILQDQNSAARKRQPRKFRR
jgi:ATP-dependent RNA helicase SUPV3L1/SUV3